MTSIVKKWRNSFFRFVDRRNPVANQRVLAQRNLYILPTKSGFSFIALALVLWLIGTNYQNNLILALVYLILAVFVVSIIHTFSNLAGISIEYKKSIANYAGKNVGFVFLVKNNKNKESDGIRVCWQGDDKTDPLIFFVGSGEEKIIEVALSTQTRGVVKPGRLLIESRYPFGLFRCWNWSRWNAEAIVYPAPISFPLNSISIPIDEGDGAHPVKGGEDFSDFHEYRPGDSLKHIAWKTYAREQGLFVKEFNQTISEEKWLTLESISTEAIEDKLSGICFWALQFHLQDENYGLRINGVEISPDKGEAHRITILENLALFGHFGESANA